MGIARKQPRRHRNLVVLSIFSNDCAALCDHPPCFFSSQLLEFVVRPQSAGDGNPAGRRADHL
jgi:hypothetical protein